LIALLLLAACTRRQPEIGDKPEKAAVPVPQTPTLSELRAAESFASVTDKAERSRALFVEASKVFLHPRCANCHPNGDSPLQGMERSAHEPPVARGPEDDGVVGMRCSSCHQDKNLDLARVPGAPKWHLAPIEMAWTGKTPAALCNQIKDPKRNGGKTLAQIALHSAHDELVAWSWKPGHGREPAPGTQEELGRLVAAWVETGAECPPEGGRP